MDPTEALIHQAMLTAQFRARTLATEAAIHDFQHDVEQYEIENLYLRRVIAHLKGIKTPKRDEIDPWEGEFSMEALGMPPPNEMEDPDEDGRHTFISGPAQAVPTTFMTQEDKGE